jgi:hypothetical protein
MNERATGAPWYRCFWPWFIVVLLGTSVAGSIATAVIAISGRDALVRDDWYRDGMAVNRRIEREARAGALGISASGRLDWVTGEVRLELAGDGVADLPTLAFELSHPTRSQHDALLQLQRGDDGVFRGSLERPPSGRRFYARLEPGNEQPEWRIGGSVVLADGQTFILEPAR